MGFGLKFEDKQPDTTTEPKTQTPSVPDTPPVELNDDSIVNYINEKRGSEFKTFEDIFKGPEPKIEEKIVEKIVNPYENILDDYDKRYLDFKKETGRGRKEFEFIQQDFDKKDSLNLAFDLVRKNSGLELSENQVKEYLESKLSIDFSGDELDSTSKIELNNFTKEYREELKSLQEQYKVKATNKQTKDIPMVTLENGEQIPQEKYDILVAERTKYLDSLKESVSSAASFQINTNFGDNENKQEFTFEYNYNDVDKQSMVSDASDLNAFVQKTFHNEKGLNHLALAQFIDRGKNFNKYMTEIAQQVRAKTIEEYTANVNNENFHRKPFKKEQSKNDGYGKINQRKSGSFGLRF